MRWKPAHSGSNALLGGDAGYAKERFPGHSSVELKSGQVVVHPGTAIDFVYLPVTSVLSVQSDAGSDVWVQTAIIGNEGMAPLDVVHGATSISERLITLVPGYALRIARQEFVRAVRRLPAVQRTLRRFSVALFKYMSQASACHRQHTVQERCARCLLVIHDRIPDDEFRMIHLVLARTLGVRRPSLTLAAEALRASGAIAYSRGVVRIVDREELVRQSCGCYAAMRRAYDSCFANTTNQAAHSLRAPIPAGTSAMEAST